MKKKIFPKVEKIENLNKRDYFRDSIFRTDALNPIKFLIRSHCKKINISGIFSTFEKLGITPLYFKTINKKGFLICSFSLRVLNKKQVSIMLNEFKILDEHLLLCVSDLTFLLHDGGKIRVENKVNIESERSLSMVYTPGVGKI